MKKKTKKKRKIPSIFDIAYYEYRYCPICTNLNNKRMEKEELKKEVDRIIAMSGDDEAAHSSEDDLHLEVIKNFCPDWVVAEVERLSKADFARWCA